MLFRTPGLPLVMGHRLQVTPETTRRSPTGNIWDDPVRAGVTGITISRVSGHGGERPLVETYRATAVSLEFREKVKIEMACSEPYVQPTIDLETGRVLFAPAGAGVRRR